MKDEIIKNTGSIIHWDTLAIRRIFKRNRLCVLITCGNCKRERFVVIHKNLKNRITGLCFNCFKRASWKIKRNKLPQKRKSSHGYIVLWKPGHPMANKRNEVYEHRLIMAQILDRSLESWEHVHHKNGDKTDNRPENLELINPQKHQIFTQLESQIKHLESILIKHNIPF